MRRQLSRWSAVGVVALVSSALVPAASWQSDAASPHAASAVAAKAPLDGRIVAFNIDTGRLETLNPDGSARRVISPAGESDFQPSWSPDATHVVFASDHAGPDPRIFTRKADGSGLKQITTAPDGYVDNTPTYTPDGQRLVFTRCLPDPPGGCSLFSIRLDGSGLKPITPALSDQADFYPDVTPDGTRIAFVRFDAGGIIAQVWVARIDGTHAQPVTTPALEAGTPKWTVDGHHILVTSSTAHQGSNVYSLRDDGTQVTKLTSAKFPNNSVFPAMSPSGTHIVYSDDQAYPGVIGADLWVMNPDGSGKHPIATHTRLISADWSTGPLLPSGSSSSVAPKSLAKAAPDANPTLPTWVAEHVVPRVSASSKWTR